MQRTGEKFFMFKRKFNDVSVVNNAINKMINDDMSAETEKIVPKIFNTGKNI